MSTHTLLNEERVATDAARRYPREDMSQPFDKPKPTSAVAEDSPSRLTFAVCGYATCSSLMLIMNKLSVHFLPAPGFVLLLQLLTSAFATWAAGACAAAAAAAAAAAVALAAHAPCPRPAQARSASSRSTPSSGRRSSPSSP